MPNENGGRRRDCGERQSGTHQCTSDVPSLRITRSFFLLTERVCACSSVPGVYAAFSRHSVTDINERTGSRDAI
jgi:hypothetical protein